ncbi:unnamed protein product [Sphagnum balticum]
MVKEEMAVVPLSNLQINIDWVSYGAVSPVKDQGSCLAPYAFAAAGAIEGISVIFFKTTSEYSVQQIIDCSSSYGNQACNGGTMVASYNYIASYGNPTLIQESTQKPHTPTGDSSRPANPPQGYSGSGVTPTRPAAPHSRPPSLAGPFRWQLTAATSPPMEAESSTIAEPP